MPYWLLIIINLSLINSPLFSLPNLVASLSCFYGTLWSHQRFSEPQGAVPPSLVNSVWGAASILPGPGTWVTPAINQALLLSHLAILFPKDKFILGTGLGWTKKPWLSDALSSGHYIRYTSSEQEDSVRTADRGWYRAWHIFLGAGGSGLTAVLGLSVLVQNLYISTTFKCSNSLHAFSRIHFCLFILNKRKAVIIHLQFF